MNRQVIAICAALSLGIAFMPTADASRRSKWSDWSPPVNLGPGINTAFVDASPAISKDGLTLYFNSNRDDPQGDLYVAKRERVDLPWNDPVNLGETINTAAFEGFVALSRNEHHLFFVRSPGDIYVSYRADVGADFGETGWGSPQPLAAGVNTSAPEQGPSYFENRKRGLPQLFFHSVRPDGVGAVDIYVAEAFGTGILVPGLNSTATDARPSITANGLEIFFHSNRAGSANFDMYKAVRKSVLEPWSEPETLGTDVNSIANDLLGAISPDGETLFFTSNRDGGFGQNDIYMTTRSRHGRH
jgi:Tol biopolymer transport system component